MGFRFDGQADIAAGGRQLRRRCWLGGAARPVLALVAANNRLAGATGLEPATFGVTGRRSKPTELRPRGRVAEVNRRPRQVKAAAGKRPCHARNRKTPPPCAPIYPRQWLISSAGH